METAKLKKFAQFARRSLLEQVSAKLRLVLAEDSAARRESPEAVKKLEEAIKEHGKEQVIERVAYIWFNRFCALRFMDVNRYNRVNIVSPADPGQFQPEILAEAKMGHIDEEMVHDKVRQQIFALLDGKAPSRDPQGEAYRLLVVAACNFWNKAMPFLFQRIDDYTELLMPDDLLSGNSILAYTREAMTPDACGAEPVGSGKWIVDSNSDSSHSPLSTLHSNAGGVEVIGWLYQFYISEKKDEVFDGLKKNKKITPENIPAATQLFTPHWIVRYLVENSLGRLWLLNRPGSKLAEQMDYYIKPVESGECEVGSKSDSTHSPLPTTHLRISSPEEIRICDPACGSGHMLTYAFDLLYAIYEEEGYEPAEIPEKILTNNLYGIEIDERAGELAAFALTMKARSRSRRFFRKAVMPNICVLGNVKFDDGELAAVGSEKWVAGSEKQQALHHDLHLFEEADNFGSLLRPQLALEDIESIQKTIHSTLSTSHSLFESATHQKVLQALRQADYLSPKYHVVIANPPYMGGKGMNGRLGAWLKDNYEDVKSDLFSAFIVRNTEMTLPKGQLGFMSPFVWMFISSYEKLRSFLINQKTITSLVQLEYSGFDGATVPICTFTVENAHRPDFKGGYVRLSDFRGSENQGPRTLEAIKNPDCGWLFRSSAADFKKIPGSPIAYWVSDQALNVFEQSKLLGQLVEPRQGMATTNNNRFLRLWQEVALVKLGTGFESTDQASNSGKKWFSYNKGGDFRKWYGNNFYVVNYEEDGRDLKIEVKAKYREKDYAKGFSDEKWDKLIEVWVLKNQQFYFKPSVTWTYISSAYFGARFCPQGFIFDVGGSSIFPSPNEIMAYTGLMCSKLSTYFLKALNPTLNFQVENIAAIPVSDSIDDIDPDCSRQGIKIAKDDWDSFETSWDFTGLPLLNPGYHQPTLKATYQKLRSHWREMSLEMQRLEEENNHIFIDAYGLQDELTPEVPLTEITLTCNPHYRYGNDKSEDELEALLLADTMRELVSYAVGCMFGRYALDKPGLILANQGETLADFVRKVCSEEWVVDSEGENNGDRSQLQRVNSLAEGDGLGGTGLSGHQAVPEGGTLRVNQSSQAVSGFHSIEHSGRSGQKIDGGVSEFLVHCERFKSRDGDPNPACPALELCNDRYSATNSQSVRGSEPPAERADEQPEVTTHCPLSTIHFLPDDDNVIPMLDGDWFTDDIAERFRKFLRVAFGEEHYEANLKFVEQALNIKGKRNYSIRDYFLGEFYTDHVKRYKKRPIYWLFSSPKGSFNALIYMHRYRPDTVSVVLNDYLREFRTKLTSHKNHLEAVSISASSSQGEKTKALKEIEKITKMIAEMEEYEREVLYPLATEQVEIDLDEGVKVNYPKLGAALKKIVGLDAKED